MHFSDARKFKINKKLYRYDNISPKVFYGLPKKVKFCKLCVISNQRPNSTVEYKNDSKNSKKSTINLGEDGICDACKVNTHKQQIDWDKRRKELYKLCDKHRKKNGEYDCIVPGSGGKDSAYASWILKNKFGMHPLTVTWAPHLYIATENLLHPFQPFIIGQKMIAPKLAQLLDIPLVFYGENEAEYGNPLSDVYKSKRSSIYHSLGKKDDIFLGGLNINIIKDCFGLSIYRILSY